MKIKNGEVDKINAKALKEISEHIADSLALLRVVALSEQARMAMNPKNACRFMYRPEDWNPDVQQKLRVSNAPTIDQARRMSKAHGNNYYDRTSN